MKLDTIYILSQLFLLEQIIEAVGVGFVNLCDLFVTDLTIMIDVPIIYNSLVRKVSLKLNVA